MNAVTSAGCRRARSQKHARGLEDLICTTQLRDLTPERFDLRTLLSAGQIRPQATICLGLAHMLAQRFVMDPKIVCDVSDRTTRLDRQPDPAVNQLLRILTRS
jgi:hypothetical protein